MASPGRVIFLTGAPDSEQLDWSESKLIFQVTIGRERHQQGLIQPTPTWEPPKWRAVPFTCNAASQDAAPPQTQFLSFGSFGAGAEIPELEQLSQESFLEHSLALLDDLATSQIAPTGHEQTTFLTNTISFESTVTDYSDPSLVSDSFVAYDQTKPTGPITDLKAVPSASHITQIIPQTITINLLCAIISVSPSRTVTLKKRKGEMEIQELLLGDETRAGFSVSFWLVPQDSQHIPADDLREALRPLRTGDVVLVSNVALSAFKGCVYGQSLSRRVARNSTNIVKVERVDGVSGMGGKCVKVFEWAERFVGRSTGVKSGRSLKRGREKDEEEEDGEVLPPDTQT